MTKGDVVTIEYDGGSIEGTVILASPNEKSLMLTFEGMIGGHIGMMPVLREDDGEYHSVLDGMRVTLRRRADVR